jgi:Ser-tRNA(Ala) deacylase AlaX
MTPQEKATKLYSDAYNRWCYELSHEKNYHTAKNICEYICRELYGVAKWGGRIEGEDAEVDSKEYWEDVRDIIRKSNHNELYNR